MGGSDEPIRNSIFKKKKRFVSNVKSGSKMFSEDDASVLPRYVKVNDPVLFPSTAANRKNGNIGFCSWMRCVLIASDVACCRGSFKTIIRLRADIDFD